MEYRETRYRRKWDTGSLGYREPEIQRGKDAKRQVCRETLIKRQQDPRETGIHGHADM